MSHRRLGIVTLACTIAIGAALFFLPAGLLAQSNGILREVYTGIAGGAIANLTSHPSFPNSPALESIEPIFEGPTAGDFYGTRMRALLTAPTTGNYIFWIATDDQGYLYLSTDDTPTTRRLICAEPQWGSVREWEGNLERRTNATAIFPAMNPNLPANRSDYAFGTITLNAGQRYYVEALQAEGQGGDNIAVGWQLPDGTLERPIPGNRMVPYGLGPPVILQQPANSSVIEGGPASFNVRLQRMLGATYQWRRNGAAIPGATNFSYLIPVTSLADSNTSYSCSITNSYGGTNSSGGILTVIPDSLPPTINTVGNLGEPQVVFVVFSEPVEALSATNLANYGITGGPMMVTLARAAFGADNRTIILTTTTLLAPGVTYTLTVNNVRDRATIPNTIQANSQRTFSLIVRPLDISYLSLPREPLGPSSRRHGVIISEVMFHPTNRADAKNLEFLEVYNSQPWFEELGGWRISGAIDFTFPSNTVLPSKGFLVVAANPADFKSVYTIVPATNVFGPFLGSNGLQNSSGTLRLRNNADAVLFEMHYTGDPPYPAAADGGGHSLVLGRPSYGERDTRAWVASESAGGTPGAADVPTGNTFRNILINEILAHTDPPNVDFIELHNYGTSSLNLNGVIVTDDPNTNKFVITAAIGNTIIPGRGFLVLTESQLGFALSASGETIFLKHPSGQRVIDALKYESQENGVPLGRYPDGANAWTRLAAPTPGSNNAPYKATQVVINELMIDPVSGDENDEFVELHNRGTNFVHVGGWRLRDGISFNIPQGTIIPAGGYLVIAKNAAHLRANYAALGTVNCLGDYSGVLANNGERVELNFPDELVSTNGLGQLRTNTIHVAIDEVTYGPGGRWGRFADGGGSSLELRDARSDRRLAPNWADSDESAKSGWFTVEATGTMDNGYSDANQLHVTLLGEGETLIDDIELIPAGSTNVIGNGTFEAGIDGWVFQGNHARTSWESTTGYNSARCLHLRASGRGDTGPNRVRTQLPYTLAPGTVVTVRAKARWLKGNPNVSLRVRGNWIEAVSYALTAKNLGTPGLPNSRAVPNAGPAVTEVLHYPALPAASQQVLVTAHVHDPDGLAFLAVNYRVDPSATYNAVAMTNNGAGLYSTVIPGQAAGGTVAFFVQAIDNFSVPAASTFPDDAPNRECVVRWGDTTIPGTLGMYRLWLTQTNVSRWTADGKMSNEPKDTTFIYGTNRIAYNTGAWFHGSPWHSPAYDSPVGASCDYDMGFMEDEPLLGETDINLFRPGNGGGEPTAQAEVHGYWFGGQFGVSFLYHRPVFVFVNGQRRDNLFHDAQQPNGDFVEQWYPDDADGDLHKIQIGFEFGDTAYGYGEPGFAAAGADLNRYLTTGGAFKQARYRQTWARRSATFEEQNDYTNIYALVNVAMTSAPLGSDAYTTTLTAATDVEEWYKIHVTQHLYNNGDSFSYGGGQNAFAYKPRRDTWKLFLWDIDFAFGGDPADANLTGIGGPEHGPRNDHPPFARIYWQTLLEAANGMMTPARSDRILDARFNGMNAAGGNVGSPAGIKSFIATRRNVILSQAASRQAPFTITSNGGSDFATNRNLITLSGTAPLEARSILINGAAFPVTWTSISNWTIRIPLLAGTNTLVFTAIDPKGATVAGVSGTIRVNYTGANELPQDRIVLNEVMYNPVFANASYVEIYNTSPSNAFDMSGWRLNGVDLTFANGTVLEPGQFLIAAKDRQVFADTYGPSIPVAADFPGSLDNGGETLTLLKPGPTPAEDAIVDQLTYDDDLPWPAAADGGGPSLQLIDPLQDNNRSANWAAVTAASTNAPQTLLRFTNVWRYMQTQNLDGINWIAPAYTDAGWPSGPGLLAYETCGCLPDVIRTTLVTNTGRITFYFRTHFNFSGSPAGASLKISTVLDDGAVFYLNGQEIFRQNMAGGPVIYGTFATPGVGDATFTGPVTISGSALLSGDNVLAVEVHQSSTTSSDLVFGMSLETTYDVLSRYTPGTANSVRSTLPPFPRLWLNEVLATNFFLGTNGITDGAGERDPWVELYNGGTNALSLAGYYLANNYSNLTQWAFPANASIGPKQFFVVWLDGEIGESTPTEYHANFRTAPGVGSVVLSKGATLADVVDHLNYNVPVPGRSYGSFPDGAVSGRRLFSIVTPATTNNPATPPADVRINEWMADNDFTVADPADGNYEDWFEIYNPGTNFADLSGYFLTDTLSNKTQWQIPEGTIIPAGGYLLVWADEETGQNDPGRADLHADFKLSAGGESIWLFAPDGQIVDGVEFGGQTTDISQGRFPDGAASIYLMTNATPRAANSVASANTPPTLSLLIDRTVNEGSALTFTAAANDVDLPAQTLTFSLGPGAPAGAGINSSNGLFAWTPAEAQGPGSYPITVRVTDDGTPNLSATRSFTVTVNEANNAPTLAPLLSRTVTEGSLLTVTNSATDSDTPPQSFTYSLDPGAPAGAAINPTNGVFTWTPSEAQGPGNHAIVIRVTDSGDPPMSGTGTLTVSVIEVNVAPSLSFATNQSVDAESTLSFAAMATDSDLPEQLISFSLAPGYPAGAGIDPSSGLFTWTPTMAQIGTHNLTVRATDDGTPPATGTRPLTVFVQSTLRAKIALNGSQATISFATLNGHHYRVEYKHNLDAAAWTELASGTGTGSTLAFPDNLGANTHRFYRIVQTD
jgi:hypothetical protein